MARAAPRHRRGRPGALRRPWRLQRSSVPRLWEIDLYPPSARERQRRGDFGGHLDETGRPLGRAIEVDLGIGLGDPGQGIPQAAVLQLSDVGMALAELAEEIFG